MARSLLLVSIDPVRGALAWRPTAQQTGVQEIEIAVDDARGGTAAQRFSLDLVFDAPPPSPSARTASTDAGAAGGEAPPAAPADAAAE